MTGALAGRRVVITRPRDQAATLADLLRARGAEPVVVPLIEVVDVPGEVARLAAMDLTAFAWVLVTSPSSAARLRRVHSLDGPLPKLAAVGTATAAVLGRCDLVPGEQRAAGLVAAMPPGDGDRALVVQAVDGAPTLVDGLVDRGWTVEVVRPVQARSVAPSADERAAVSAADAVLFASGSAARGWVAAFGAAAPPLVVAIGPQTAADVTAAGLKVSLVATDHSPAGLVASLERHLASLG